MHVGLEVLAAQDFRNLETFRIEPGPRFNLFEGRNGQGKTNLLEAVYLLSAFRSPRDAKQGELVRFGAERAVVYGEIVRREVKRTVEIQLAKEGKKVLLDGKVITRMPSSFSHMAAVLFGPDDLELTKAGPEVRRRFLDRATFAVWPEHLLELRAYHEALKHRNRLLRDAKVRGVALDPHVLDAFEGELARRGASVLMRRHLFLERFVVHFAEAFRQITDGELTATLTHKASGFDHADSHKASGSEAAGRDFGVAAMPSVALELAAALSRARASDAKLGWTRLGPHADELDLMIDGRPVRAFASQGQHRAFVLALKIAELHRIHEAHGVYPVFLLDDVSSELDERRNALLMETLQRGGGQVFVTTTDRRWIRVGDDAMRRWKVEAGVLSAE
ncbi:MAG: DNA replication and repair protein RecF [Deltaproteobacteria bacterium]|nr:DNA replication and repair protein RecF [Deltaproteobacteria bacterium]